MKITPRELLRSFSWRPGLTKRQISKNTYGKATIKPTTNDTHRCMVNCPAILVLSSSKGMSVKQNASPPICWDSQHSARYDKKSGLRGPKITLSNTMPLNTKAKMLTPKMAIAARIRCQRNSSRWSKKDICPLVWSVFLAIFLVYKAICCVFIACPSSCSSCLCGHLGSASSSSPCACLQTVSSSGLLLEYRDHSP